MVAMIAGLVAALAAAGPAPAASADRLDRFRALASSGLAPAQLDSGDATPPAVTDLYSIVDEEIVENLESGAPFSSIEFIQERLDAFESAWGGAAFRVFRPAGRAVPVTIAVLSLAGVPGSGSVRLYGRVDGGIGLTRTVTRDGVADLFEWAPAPDGSAQWLVSWTGPASGRGSRPLRLELWRQPRVGEPSSVWSTASMFPDGLWVSDWTVRRAEISVRYELRYPGWKPGCEGQTEQEDIFRPGAGATPDRKSVV